jgi:hypothetical protein
MNKKLNLNKTYTTMQVCGGYDECGYYTHYKDKHRCVFHQVGGDACTYSPKFERYRQCVKSKNQTLEEINQMEINKLKEIGTWG